MIRFLRARIGYQMLNTGIGRTAARCLGRWLCRPNEVAVIIESAPSNGKRFRALSKLRLAFPGAPYLFIFISVLPDAFASGTFGPSGYSEFGRISFGWDASF